MYNILHIPTGLYVYFITSWNHTRYIVLDRNPYGIMDCSSAYLELPNTTKWFLNGDDPRHSVQCGISEFEFIEVDPLG